MRRSAALLAVSALLCPLSLLCAQENPAGALLGAKEAGDLATRITQLMESTAVAAPDLLRASEPVRQNANATLKAISQNSQSPALTWQLISQVRAYLALSDSISRPYPFPPTAEKQFGELHEDLDRLQRHFAALLAAGASADQRRNADPNGLSRYADADSKLLPPDSKMARVVFLGDSITDLWRLNEYFTGRAFVNRGISGQTTSQMLARFRQDVIALNPKVVVILGGINDIAAGTAPRQIEDNLAAMGDLAKVHNIRAIFASILPVSDYHKDVDPRFEMTKSRPPETILAVNKWIQTLCLTGGFTWMDYYSAVVDSSGHLKADLSDNGLDPNGKGYRVMSPITLETIDRVISRQSPDPEENARRHFKILGR